MFKISKTKKIILATLFTCGINYAAVELPKAQALFEAKTDTNADTFDYIENQRRERRARALTDEQKTLLADIEEAKQRLPKPIEEGEPIPAAFEGDNLTYNTLTGEFTAKGHVDIIQLEGYRFQTLEAKGNINTQEIRIKNKAHVLQLKEDAPRVTLDGYNTVYNYGTKEGTMENVKGKAADYYIYGKRFEFYPDHIVAYDAYQTKCGAKHPDYRVSAKRMEIWPEQIIRMYDIQLWIGDMIVGTKKYDERKLESNGEPYFPTVGYNSERGAYIEDHFEFPVFNEHFKYVINPTIDHKNGVRSNTEFHYDNRDFKVRAFYGYYYDGEGRWIKKEPGIDFYYYRHLKILPLSYHVEYEIGRWSFRNISSTHEEFEVGLDRDPIRFNKNFTLFLGTSYKITRDDEKSPTRQKTSVRGMNYKARLVKEFDDTFAAFVAYEYTKNTSQNSLYAFDNDSFSHKFLTGISYRITDKDRIVAGLKFNTASGSLEDVDYYWFRDLHCSTAILRWRAKRKEFEARWQFTPW